jgi:hypothetical protein
MSHIAEETTRANLRPWSAVLAADEWQRAWEAMAEPAGEEPERRAQRALICRCDGCGKPADLNDDGVTVTADDEIICRHCGEAPYLAEDNL